MWPKTVLLTCLVLAAALVMALIYGASSWQAGTTALRKRLRSAGVPLTPSTYDPRELEGLPPPVQRYFCAALTAGQAIVATAQIAHEGQFNMGTARATWRPFTSDQLVVTRRPGFDWDARIHLAPGVRVFVRDAYVAGEGAVHASLFGLATVADLRGTHEVAEGELTRFLAEAVWYPTALLPSQGVSWEAVDDTSARASLVDGSTTVSLEFRFGAEGLIHAVYAAARPRTVNGALVATPWQGRFWAHDVRDGMRVPLRGEVAWLLPEGPWPYWRGRVTDIVYERVR
jgi:hypothetical protein